MLPCRGGQEEDAPKNEAGAKADKGIEMEQDFDGEMMDLSEDEPEEEDENQEEEKEENLESKMGEDEDNSEVIDEKLWNNEEELDQGPDGKEKYEKDSGVSGAEPEDLEMRGKEEETNEDDSNKGEKDKEKAGSKDPAEKQPEATEEPEMEAREDDHNGNEDAVEEKTGVQPSTEETLDIPENPAPDGGEDEGGQEQQEETETAGDEQEGNEGTDGTDLPEQMNLDDESPEGQNEEAGDPESNLSVPDTADGGDEGSLDLEVDDEVTNNETDGEENQDSETDYNAAELNKEVDGATQDQHMEEPTEQGENPSDPKSVDATPGKREEHTNVVAGIKGIASQIDNADNDLDKMGMTEAPQEEKLTGGAEQSSLEAVDGKNRSNLPESSTSSSRDRQNLDRPDINPYRSLGDALKHWKERINVVDRAEAPLTVEDSEAPEEEPLTEGDDVMDYEFVTNEEEGTAQALGSATKEQLDENKDHEVVPLDKDAGGDLRQPDVDTQNVEKDEIPDKLDQTHVFANNRKHKSLKTQADDSTDRSIENDVEKDIGMLGLEDAAEPTDAGEESIVTLESQQKVANPSRELRFLDSAAETWTEEEISRVRRDLELGLKEMAGNIDAARLVWQKYENLTARLSQELAEQLRMILEPTLASRLQGDYRTGKRINMKKVGT